MATVRDLIKNSMRLVGIIGSTETPSADEQADALSALNAMLSSWSTEDLVIYQVTREEFSLTSGDGTYTMGASGDFNTTRPVEITRAMLEDQSGIPTQEYPIEIITPEEYAQIATKDLQADFPTKLYPDYGNPLVTVTLYPVPSAANKLVLYSKKPLTTFTSYSTELTFPPGYEKALKYNLAIEIAPEYGKEPSATIVSQAIESKANIKRKNSKPRYLVTDHPMRGRKSFNVNEG